MKVSMASRRPIFLSILAVAFLLQAIPLPAGASATLFFSPSAKTVQMDDTFSVAFMVNSGGQAINAAEATINFPTDKLDVKSVSKSGSIFSLWAVDPKFSNASGTIYFSGGKPSPGYKGSAGKIITVTFQAQATGSAKLTISGAQVLANDGQGTNVYGGGGTSTITINNKVTPPPPPPPPPPTPTKAAPSISSESHPDQSAWYASGNVIASWTAGAGVTGYSVLFGQTKVDAPETKTTTATSFSRASVGDGKWYLSVRALYGDIWSPAATYVVQIDATAPEAFTITVEQTSPGDANPKFVFAAKDPSSGVVKYELRLDAGEYALAASPQQVSNLTSGSHSVMVRATDKAGNVREATATFTVASVAVLNVAFEQKPVKIAGDPEPKITVASGEALIMRGFAKATEKLHVLIHSQDTVFDFPVAENVDPSPVQPAPPGYDAWKLEIPVNVAPGDHELRVSTIDENGNVTAEGVVVKFRVLKNSLRVGSTYISIAFLIKILVAVFATLFVLALLFALLYFRLRRRLRKTPPDSVAINKKDPRLR